MDTRLRKVPHEILLAETARYIENSQPDRDNITGSTLTNLISNERRGRLVEPSSRAYGIPRRTRKSSSILSILDDHDHVREGLGVLRHQHTLSIAEFKKEVNISRGDWEMAAQSLTDREDEYPFTLG